MPRQRTRLCGAAEGGQGRSVPTKNTPLRVSSWLACRGMRRASRNARHQDAAN